MSQTHSYIFCLVLKFKAKRLILVSLNFILVESRNHPWPSSNSFNPGKLCQNVIVYRLYIKTWIYSPIVCICWSIIYNSIKLVLSEVLFKSWLCSLSATWTILSFNFLFCEMRIIITTFLGWCEDGGIMCVYVPTSSAILAHRCPINNC